MLLIDIPTLEVADIFLTLIQTLIDVMLNIWLTAFFETIIEDFFFNIIADFFGLRGTYGIEQPLAWGLFIIILLTALGVAFYKRKVPML